MAKVGLSWAHGGSLITLFLFFSGKRMVLLAEGRRVNLSCSSVPSFVVSITAATQVSHLSYCALLCESGPLLPGSCADRAVQCPARAIQGWRLPDAQAHGWVCGLSPYSSLWGLILYLTLWSQPWILIRPTSRSFRKNKPSTWGCPRQVDFLLKWQKNNGLWLNLLNFRSLQTKLLSLLMKNRWCLGGALHMKKQPI